MLGLAGVGGDGRDAGEASEGSFVAAAAGVGPRHDHLRGGDGADTGFVEELGCRCGDEGLELPVDRGELALEVADASGDMPQGGLGAGGLVVEALAQAHPLTGLHQGRGGEVTELLAQPDRGGHHQRFERVDRGDASGLGATTGHQQGPDPFTGPAGAGLGQLLATQELAGCPDRVELVGLGAVIRRAGLGATELEHPLAGALQRRAQPGAIGPGSLDRPHPALGNRLGIGPLQRRRVAGRRRRERRLGMHAAGLRVNQRHREPITIRVDPDDVIHHLCQHRCASFGMRMSWCRHGKDRCGSTVMGHAHFERTGS